MKSGNGWLWLLAVVMLSALAWGLEQIVFAPLQTGDAYPPFSSLRADPLGARALYDSLAELPGIRVERLYKQRERLDNPGDTMLVLGVDPRLWSAIGYESLENESLQEYEKLVKDGGRLVIAFLPVRTHVIETKQTPPVTVRWHIELAFRPEADATLPGMPHKTALWFDLHFFSSEAKWRTLESDPADHAAEAVERDFGKGTILLLADSFPLSNEGLRDARNPELIARMIGPARRVIFDENHFGVVEAGSVTQLMRRYRLQGAVGILLVVAALFLWRSASSLLPPRELATATGAAKNAVAGRDSLEGLTALLHRGVSKKELLDACFAEWSKSAPRESRGGRAAARIEEEIARGGNPVDAYRAACRILTEKS
jgi:hypothetical protein